jgi:hypothetical protein
VAKLKKRNAHLGSALRYADDRWVVSLGREDIAFCRTESIADVLIAGMEWRALGQDPPRPTPEVLARLAAPG